MYIGMSKEEILAAGLDSQLLTAVSSIGATGNSVGIMSIAPLHGAVGCFALEGTLKIS